MRVLLIEPDRQTSRHIETVLRKVNFNVYATDLGEEGLDLGKLYYYDIIVLEVLDLPDMCGFELLHSLRSSKVGTPVIILSRCHEVQHKVLGLNSGADDYLTKPFHYMELFVRINAIVRRSLGHAQPIIQTGNIRVNIDTKTVEVHGRRVDFSRQQYQTLEVLSLRKGATLTKDMLLNHLYGGIDEPGGNVITSLICRLRQRLSEATGGDHYITTIPGLGYTLRDPEP